MINIGPSSDGRIIPLFEERLREVGSWLTFNGDAIYASKPWTHQNDTTTSGVWYTMKKDNTLRFGASTTTVYAIVLNWPAGGLLKLGSIEPTSNMSVRMLGAGWPLKWSKGVSGGINVEMPLLPLDTPLRWAWTLAFSGLM